MKKTCCLISALLIVCIMVTACGSGGGDAAGSESPAADPGEDTGLVLTLEELSQYDGKDGNPAYVAVDGVIYDVTDVPQWKNGEHNGYFAGQDLTDIIKNESPHGVSKLNGVPVVGKLAE